MNFLYPGFLWALTALAVPIIIHLFFFRRYKKVYFSNVKFLSEIKEETNTRNRLKHLLVLLTRLLAVAALVFAFAQPFIPNEDDGSNYESRVASIYVDNSFSMDARGEALSLFETAREKAREIAGAYEQSDRFQLITNDLEGRHQRLVSKDEFLVLLDEIEISPQTPKLSRVYARQLDALSNAQEAGRFAYLISDFQTSAVDLDLDSVIQTCLVPLKGIEQRNLAIDTAWFEAPVQVNGQQAQIRVRIHNYGNEDADQVAIKLTINENTEAIGDLAVPAGTWVEDTLTYTVNGIGWQQAEVEITDYPVTFDDSWFMSYEVATEIPVLVLSESGNNLFLDRLFGANTLFSLDRKAAGGVDYSALSDYRMIILDGLNRISTGLSAELSQFMESGGSVVVFPSANAETSSYNSFLRQVGAAVLGPKVNRKREVVELNTENQIFADVFENVPRNLALPTANFSYMLNSGALSREENLMRFRDGSTFMGRWPNGSGALYLCASPFDREATDLPIQGAIIAPLLFKTAVLGTDDQGYAHLIGGNDWIRLKSRPTNSEAQPVVQNARAEKEEFLPATRNLGNRISIHVDDQLKEAGHYLVNASSSGLDSEKETLSEFAMNYNRQESALEFLSKANLEENFAGPGVKIVEGENSALAATVTRINEGQRLWKLCLILALVFLAFETLLIRVL
ncbi:MAG: hypothetical protein ACI959_000190 [Limisphaerales bacterium]|jgi:hypothetical protein